MDAAHISTARSGDLQMTITFLERISVTHIDDALLDDALSLYAQECIDSQQEQEDFVEAYLDDEDRKAELRKAVADALGLSIMMERVDSIDEFRSALSAYDDEYPLSEVDDDIRAMKAIMLKKLAGDFIANEEGRLTPADYNAMLELAICQFDD
ncbi:TPA: hypothetical protein I8303_004505 [Aeromonas hydrophila]|jgi:hypothetical protein|nr:MULTISPECIES: hypothetical protein [Aeromonas]MDU7312678.1 hypothetical protein [Aeromonas sp.]HAT2715699.1 hypothetical protein [Aeromonas hydrophila]MBE8745344.1 hypothetical protein [Aeromonas veronii]MBL0436864.1 hypothetical protein [Aeromonas caviae]MDN6869662.1 hypothetical protein [Aeromonas caviae]